MIVDIIPAALSGETDTNSEPHLAVNPTDPSQIAASAWLPEPMGGRNTPIFVSADGGQTWSCRSTVPVQPIAADKTLGFGGLLNVLYVATLENEEDFNLVVCRSKLFAKTPMAEVGYRAGSIDQPYMAAAMINQQDRVFVGCNDWTQPNGRTAIIVDSAGNSPTPGFTPVPIEFGDPPRDDPEIRSAISANGSKVYGVFNRIISISGNRRVADVVLVRDDDVGNSGAASFTALKDDNGVPGFPVVKARTFLFDADCAPARLGRDRLGGDLAIAVDPQIADRVYLVWGEVIDDEPALHVVRSDDGGQNWSGNLRTVTKAKNPGLAINTSGTVAFLYQQVVTLPDKGDIWMTKLERTKDDFQNVQQPDTLAQFPVSELDSALKNQPQLGDYLHLTAVGNDFYGVFSSSNVPDNARFPCKVKFQRKADFTTKRLLDQDGNKVPSSVDPFFVKVTD